MADVDRDPRTGLQILSMTSTITDSIEIRVDEVQSEIERLTRYREDLVELHDHAVKILETLDRVDPEDAGNGTAAGGAVAPMPETGGEEAEAPAESKDPPSDDTDTAPLHERLYAAVLAKPGCSGSELAVALGKNPGTVSIQLNRLAKEGKIKAKRTGRSKSWWRTGHPEVASESAEAPRRGDGTQTGVEREIVRVLRDAGDDATLTVEQIRLAAGTKIKKRSIEEILATLVRRRVVRKEGREYGAIGRPGLPERPGQRVAA